MAGGNGGGGVDDATYGDGKDDAVEVGSSSGGDRVRCWRRRRRRRWRRHRMRRAGGRR